MASTFTPESLPLAVAGLFRLNGYEVSGPVEKYGGEIDLVATKTGDLFADPVYIEVTVGQVGNDKYAKDLTKLSSVQRQEPGARVMIVSSAGFTPGVLGKAESAGILALTFAQLEHRFQRFEPYIEATLVEGQEPQDLRALVEIYEEPQFDDPLGTDHATAWLSTWLTDEDAHRWLIVTGEYGTGKTALTRVLLHRWLTAYRDDSTLPIPFRIELRAFTRQFDARSLLHHFLDHNGLGHVSIEFVLSLIRDGRVVLLLDGYDEMAQYMHARERRACLEALAQLSADGARGILTSRPNYFTEAEELQILDALYTSLDNIGRLTQEEAAVIADERAVDSLFEQQIIDRVERKLRDLTPAQTEALVERKLRGDPGARDVVITLLRRIFRSTEEGTDVALSGKPVIITYLLDIADSLHAEDTENSDERVTEWQVYDIVMRNLMVRDWRAAQEIVPERRRVFLGRLALLLSRKDHSLASDEDFTEFVRSEFTAELRQVPAEARDERTRQLVTDLRRSATLTRATVAGVSGSRFSHNSLREFLASEALLAQLEIDRVQHIQIPISPAMRNFVASQLPDDLRAAVERFAAYWPRRTDGDGAGQLLSLLWDGLLSVCADQTEPVRSAIQLISGTPPDFGGVALDSLDITTLGKPMLAKARFARAALSEVSLSGADLSGADFDSAVLDEVDLSACTLQAASFRDSAFLDVDVTDAAVDGADCRGHATDFSVLDQGTRYEGLSALGLLKSRKAVTDEIDPIFVVQHHPRFDVAAKVGRVLLAGAKNQVRGLTQRGSAASDPQFARKFMVLLVNEGWLSASKGRQLVQITEVGRSHIGPFVERRHLTAEMDRVFRKAT